MSCDVPHDEQLKVYTYRLTSSFVSISTVMAVINFIMVLPTTLLNLAVLIGIFKNQNLRTIPNRLLFSICLADFIVGAFVQAIYGAHILQITQADHNCGLSNFLIYIIPVTILITMVTHAVVAVERYFSVHYTKTYQKVFGRRSINGFTIFVWALSGLCFVVPLITGKVIVGNRITICLILVSIAVCSYCYISMYQDFKQQDVKVCSKVKGAYVIREERPVERTPEEKENFSGNIRKASFFSKLYLCMLVIYIAFLVKEVLNAYGVFLGNSYYTMNYTFDTILFLNALLNPILVIRLDDELGDAAKNCIS
jgi:7 transmembrane receptor (rhodopsin family).